MADSPQLYLALKVQQKNSPTKAVKKTKQIKKDLNSRPVKKVPAKSKAKAIATFIYKKQVRKYETYLRCTQPMSIYKTLYAFKAVFGDNMGAVNTHPWS